MDNYENQVVADKEREVRELYDVLVALGKAAQQYMDGVEAIIDTPGANQLALKHELGRARDLVKRLNAARPTKPAVAPSPDRVKTAAPVPGLARPAPAMGDDLPKVTPVGPTAKRKEEAPKSSNTHYGRELDNGWTLVDWSRDGEKVLWVEQVTMISSKKTDSKIEFFELATLSGEKEYERRLWKSGLSDAYIRKIKSYGLGEELDAPLYAVMKNSLKTNEHGKFYKDVVGLIGEVSDENIVKAVSDFFKRKKDAKK